MIRCAACGHGWLEARAVEVTDVPHRNAPAVIDHGFEPDQEIRRLVEASKEAQDKFAANRQARRRRAVGWSAFAVVAISPLIMAAAFPADVVRLAPATISAYRALGQDVNVYGLELRRIEMQHMTVDGTEVLAVKGEIANITGGERKIPSLRFGLSDNSGNEVYHWSLDSGTRPLRAGEITSFVTRVASPPETAKDIEIRFAHADEIGSNTGHE
jgi:hypothetical protein